MLLLEQILKMRPLLLDTDMSPGLHISADLPDQLLLHVAGKVLHDCLQLVEGLGLASHDIGLSMPPEEEIQW